MPHAHVLAAPLGAGHAAQAGADQHAGGKNGSDPDGMGSEPLDFFGTCQAAWASC